MRIIAVFLVVLMAVLLGTTQNASAHVLLKSADGSSAAILHIMPDDDPIAGEEATLMLDTQGGVVSNVTSVVLYIANAKGVEENVEASIDRSLISSKYIFPTQGVYALRYEINNGDKKYEFTQTMRVSRGVQGESEVSMRYPWAEALLVGTGIGLLALGIIAWNHRKSIYKSSVL